MFFIVNKSNTRIIIGDLNITLGPRQAIDLDQRLSREKTERSKHLQGLVRSGVIEIKSKDEPKIKIQEKPQENKSEDLKQFKDEIISAVSKEISKIKDVKEDKGNGDISALTDLIKEFKNSLPQKEQKELEEELLDNDVLVDIHSRTIDKKLENFKETKDITYKKEKSNNDIDSNIDELENLLDL